MSNKGISILTGTSYLSATVFLPSKDFCTIMGWYRFDGDQPDTFCNVNLFTVDSGFTPIYQQIYATPNNGLDAGTIEIDNGQTFGYAPGFDWNQGVWYHYTQTFKNVGVGDYHHSLFINGLEGTFKNTTQGINAGANKIHFGDPTGTNNGFIGSVRNVKMFSECLTQSQIAEEMSATYPINYSCIGWWEMNGADDLIDKIGGNNLSVTGSIQTALVGPPALLVNSIPLKARKRTRGGLLW